MTSDPLTSADYLAAKRTVDDRALNRSVLDRFSTELDRIAEDNRPDPTGDPVRIVELGAGIGTMIARLATWNRLPEDVLYLAIDSNSFHIEHARHVVPSWLDSSGFDVTIRSTASGERDDDGDTASNTPSIDEHILARRDHSTIEIAFAVGDALSPKTIDLDHISDRSIDRSAHVSDRLDGTFDVVIAAAFLDIVDVDLALGAIDSWLGSRGVLYAPITYDGETSFDPVHPLDERIEASYHYHMDDIRDSGSSRAGRDVLKSIVKTPFAFRTTGDADWQIRSDPETRTYFAREKRFLSHLLHTIDSALVEVPESVCSTTDRREWISTRRSQLERGTLQFDAHNLDIIATA